RANKQLTDGSTKANDALTKAQNAVADATSKLAAAKAKDLAKAQQNLAAAQAALAQAQAAADAAASAVSSASNQILKDQVTEEFSSLAGVAATLTGEQIVNLVTHSHDAGLASITPNAPTQSAAVTGPTPPAIFSSTQLWPYESKSANLWAKDKDK